MSIERWSVLWSIGVIEHFDDEKKADRAIRGAQKNGGNGRKIRLVPDTEVAAKDAEIERFRETIRQREQAELAALAELDESRAEIERLRGEVAEATASKNDAYCERNAIVAALARMFPSGIRRTDIPGWDAEWHGCVFIDAPQGQMSWHYHDSDAALFSDLPPYTKEWDGHSTPDKYARLARIGNAVAAAVARERERILSIVRAEDGGGFYSGNGDYGRGADDFRCRILDAISRPTPGAAKKKSLCPRCEGQGEIVVGCGDGDEPIAMPCHECGGIRAAKED